MGAAERIDLKQQGRVLIGRAANHDSIYMIQLRPRGPQRLDAAIDGDWRQGKTPLQSLPIRLLAIA